MTRTGVTRPSDTPRVSMASPAAVTPLVHENRPVRTVPECLKRDIVTLRCESDDLRQLLRGIALKIMIGARHDPVTVPSRLVSQECLPYVVGDSDGRDVVVQAPH